MAYKYKTNTEKSKKASEESRKGGKGPEVCKKRMYGKPCNYCDAVALLYASDEKSDKALAGKTRARSTFYLNIIDLDERDKGIQIYGCGIENWRALIDFMPEDSQDEDGVDFTNPDKAFPVILTRTGKGLSTEYQIKLGQKSFKLGEKTLKSMNKLHNIIEMLEDDDVPLWKPSEGKNRLAIMPPWGQEAEGDFYKEVLYHWNTMLLDVGVSEDDGVEANTDGESDVPLFDDDLKEDGTEDVTTEEVDEEEVF